jgi:glycosyltransferase involved in cell wall biosynthesis
VVPAYNLAEFLPEALDSVAAQSEQDWECIVVDDKSPDRCGEIADEYAKNDTRFRVIHNQENQYLAGALNTGIAAARGRYVIPLDADNLLPRRALEMLVTALDQDRSIHIAYGNVEFMEPDGRRWRSGWPPEFKGEWQVSGRHGGRPANLVPSTAMFRKTVWDLTGGYRRRYRTAEDADFWTRAASYGFRAKMVTKADTLVYRNREGSMSRDEKLQDWTLWLPWSQDQSLPPAAVISNKQAPVPSHDPPKVAVVIPVGPAHRELVVDALDSVDAQSFRDWECIVVNDSGSPLRWTPSWARVIETEGQVGVARARNMGVLAASAPLFVPLDADDTLEMDALKELLAVHDKFGGYVYSDWYDKWESKEMAVWETQEYDARLLLTKGCLHSVTGLFAKDDWERVGGYDEQLSAWEDWDFQLKLAEVGCCGTRIPRPLFTYRKDTGLRREENQGQFEQSKQGIADKFEPYFSGRKKLMGCSRCPHGGGGRVAATIQPSQSKLETPAGDENGYVVVEYIGTRMGSRTFRGPTGTKYRFSASPTEKQKYVLKDDAEFFGANMEFRIVTIEKPVEVGA